MVLAAGDLHSCQDRTKAGNKKPENGYLLKGKTTVIHPSDHHLQKSREYFTDKPVIKAYLFGSQAAGAAGEDSDVAILVELDYEQRLGLLFVQMQLDLEELLDKKVDLVSARGVSKYIKPQIDQEKELIYAR